MLPSIQLFFTFLPLEHFIKSIHLEICTESKHKLIMLTLRTDGNQWISLMTYSSYDVTICCSSSVTRQACCSEKIIVARKFKINLEQPKDRMSSSSRLSFLPFTFCCNEKVHKLVSGPPVLSVTGVKALLSL